MREILPNRVFIGNALEARDLGLLYNQRISAVLDLAANEPPAQLAREMVYCRVPIIDGDGNSPVLIETAIRSLVTLIRGEFRVLVSCSAGMSRSPAIAAAALAIVTQQPPEACLVAIVANAPHDVSPSLWSSVINVYDRIHGSDAFGN